MKILTWNVNGLRSCIEKGFIDIVTNQNVDVICIQETKAERDKVKLKMDGYDEYWNSSKRSGYSGVLVLSRLPVIQVREGFGNNKFDIEGRLLTLEFEEFYLLNVYMPMSKSGLARNEYRCEWDDEFFEYIKTLEKPVIICGDFNVAHKYIDVYPENSKNEKNPAGFIEIEKDNFTRLVNYGLVDVFRQRYPNTIKYTWWSNRMNKRDENRGWRLDYFLVSHKLYTYIVDISVLNHILGSDHCPIRMDIRTKDNAMLIEENKKLAETWDNINWKEYENKLLKIQIELANATIFKDRTKVFELQEKIVNMHEAKALAIRHVTQGNTETGVDGVRYTTSAQKMVAVSVLDERNFIPSAMKSIMIFDGKKERRINIPTYHDRAMAMLLKYALDPIAETQSDRKSFGFRKGRSAFDACRYVEVTMKKNTDLWVLKADIKAYYETICHEWITTNIPCLRTSVKKLMKAGIVLNGELFPSNLGISLGLNISPTLANMVLDGLQNYVQQRLYNNCDIDDYTYGDMIRYADDFIFFAQSEEQAKLIKDIVIEFLNERGLRLSEEKTVICHANDGFDFLGWNFKQVNKIVKITPSHSNVAKFESNIELKILSHKTSTESLILKLNKSIIGYATYHKHIDNTEVFRHLDVVVNALLVKKIKQQHPKRHFNHLKKLYWYRNSKGEHIFTHPDKKHLQVIQFKDIPKVYHFSIKTSFNYYLDYEYYIELTQKRQEDKRVGDHLGIWKAQGGNCYFCGKPILPDQFTKIVNLYQKNKKALIHSRCQYNIFQYVLDGEEVKALNIEEVLEHPIEKETYSNYLGLRYYFKKESRQVFTLTFKQIGEIIGEELEVTTIEFWYDCEFEGISNCWLDNGYIIQKLNLEDKKVIFRKDNHTLTQFKIPKALTQKKIPKNAQDEITTFMKYIVDKYGL